MFQDKLAIYQTNRVSGKLTVMIGTRKRYAGMLISALLLLAVASNAHADTAFILSGMKPEQVFEITLLWDNGTSYRQYAYVDDGQGICEIDASGATGRQAILQKRKHRLSKLHSQNQGFLTDKLLLFLYHGIKHNIIQKQRCNPVWNSSCDLRL